MKKNRFIPTLVLILAFSICLLSFSGCAFSGDPHLSTTPTGSTAPSSEHTTPSTQPTTISTVSTTIPTQVTTIPTEPSMPYIVPEEYPVIFTREYVYQAPTLPIPAQDAPEEEWIAFFYGLLRKEDSWYNKMLTSYYATPEEIDIDWVIWNGVTNSGGKLTDAEIAFLKERNWIFEMDTFRTTAPELDALLRTYLGTTLEACKQVRPIEHAYFPDTDSYYASTTGVYYQDVRAISGYRILENGDYCVRYYCLYDNRVSEVVLRRQGDYFQIVSNLPVVEISPATP